MLMMLLLLRRKSVMERGGEERRREADSGGKSFLHEGGFRWNGGLERSVEQGRSGPGTRLEQRHKVRPCVQPSYLNHALLNLRKDLVHFGYDQPVVDLSGHPFLCNLKQKSRSYAG